MLTTAFGRQSPTEGTAAKASEPLGLVTSQLEGKASPTEYLAALNLCQSAYGALLDIHRQSIRHASAV